MIVSEKEFEQMKIEVDGCVFTPVVNLIEEFKDEVVKDPDGKYTTQKKPVFKYEILKTAEEVYKEYLDCKDAPVIEDKPINEEVETLKAKIKVMEQDMADILLSII